MFIHIDVLLRIVHLHLLIDVRKRFKSRHGNQEFLKMAEPPGKPSPPIVGKVSHDTVELHWDQDYAGSYNGEGGRRRYCIQEEELRKQNGFGNVYNGFARSNVFKGLDPNAGYRYRLRISNDYGNSPWSSTITVNTTKVPLIGKDIHRAILNWEVEKVKAIIEETSEESLVNVPDDLGMSPLMLASQKGYSSIVELLVEHGAMVNYSNSSKKTSLMLACFGGHLTIASFLKEHGAVLDFKDVSGSDALHWAVDGDKEEVVQWLLRCGVNVDELDNSSWSPLMKLANLGGSVAVAKVLIEGGAQVNRADKTGTTPLMAAAVNGNLDLCKLFVEKGADLTITNQYGRIPLDFAESFERKDVIQFLTNASQERHPSDPE